MGSYHFQTGLLRPPVNLQSWDVYQRQTLCPTIRTHRAWDGRDYRTVGKNEWAQSSLKDHKRRSMQASGQAVVGFAASSSHSYDRLSSS